ncbi:hypothetical protein RMCBS344292_19367 [Rhizopus microsporus]|nr:hypothetical protein RMCBS344292_19367 [Rhizopus microsporus]
MCASEDEERNARTHIQDDSSFRTIEFFDQQREEHPGTSTSTVVPWLPVQFSRHDHTSSTEIMSIDSEPYWEDNCHDTGDWGSTPSCEISTEEPSKNTQVT